MKKDVGESQFEASVEQDLAETEGIAQQAIAADPQSLEATSWQRAREVVKGFKPVPWFIWRIANYVLGKPGDVRPLSEGALFGLRKLICGIASDPSIGSGESVTTTRRALEVVPHDVIAAGAVIHAICRRLGGRDFERIWRPIIDDAILRAHIGFMVGEQCPDFGGGRGMLAGFAGRSGLAVLIGCGTKEQAQAALEGLAAGGDIATVGLKVYGCNPLQVSAMLLSASGVGKDAAFGSVSYAIIDRAGAVLTNQEQQRWLAAFAIAEALRMNRPEGIAPGWWAALDLSDPGEQTELIERTVPLIRRGTHWGWLE
jgi:hypothetical protein